jgi:GNAT superfamily N-acetyltransferase
MTDIHEYIQLARESGAYKDIELDILKETLASWAERPGDPVSVVELRDGKILAGFAVYARVPNTDFTFDVRAICVDKVYRGKGVGQKLAETLEEETLRQSTQVIIRFEISRRKEESVGSGFLIDAGFSLIGHIAAFYDSEDDYYIYAKHFPLPPVEDTEKASKKPVAAEEKVDGAESTAGGKTP